MSAAPVLWAGLAATAALPALREALRKPLSDTERESAPGQFAPLPGGRTHYTWSGKPSGPVAICIHGLTTPSFAWDGLVPHLSQMGFRVLTYDLYGRGYSDRPRNRQTPAFFTRQLRDLMVHLKLHEDITLIGYSMGGVIAAAYAAHHAHQLRRVILIAPAGLKTELGRLPRFAANWPGIGDWLFHMGFPAQMRRHWAEEAARPDTPPDLDTRMAAELDRRGYIRAVLSSLRHTLREPIPAIHKQLANAQVPVGAIWGQDDTTIPIASLGQLAQWNRTARQAVVDGAGHGLPYTHSQAVADAIRDVAELR